MSLLRRVGRTASLLPALALAVSLAACDGTSGPSGGSETPGFDLVVEIPVGDRPLDVTVAGDYYVVGNNFESLMLIDATTLAVVDTLDPAGFFPRDLFYHAASQSLILVDEASGKVRSVSLPGLTIDWTLTIPTNHDPFFSNPVGLAWDADNDRLYSLEADEGVIAVIPRTGGAIDTVRYRPAAGGSFQIEVGKATAVDAALNRLYLTSRDQSRVFSYSTTSLAKLDSLSGPDNDMSLVNSLLADPVNGQLIVNRTVAATVGGGKYEGALEIYDGTTLDKITDVAIPDWPEDGGMCWVDEGSAMAVVSGTWLLEFSVPGYTRLYAGDLLSTGSRVAYDAARQRFVVTFNDEDVVRIYTRSEIQ